METKKFKLNLIYVLKWISISICFGVFCGIIGLLFFKFIQTVTAFRISHRNIVYLIPIGALLSVGLNKLLNTTHLGTNDVINSVNSSKTFNPKLLPAIFASAIITHLFGGSAGREGAALQMGGGAAVYTGKLLRLKDYELSVLTIAGMGAVFSALFGTPVGACVFALEVAYSRKIVFKALIPTIISSFSAFGVSTRLGSHPERFIVVSPQYDVSTILKTIIISFAVIVVGCLFCYLIKYCHANFNKIIKNDYWLIFVGSVMILLLTVMVGNQDYNGSGSELILRVFEDRRVNCYDFILKLIFTVLTVSIGLRGGEIVPSFCIGATLGAYLSITLGIDITIGAAIGMAAIFSTVTKCPLATISICFEMFGLGCLPLCLISVLLSVFISSKNGLYDYKRNNLTLLRFIKASRKE